MLLAVRSHPRHALGLSPDEALFSRTQNPAEETNADAKARAHAGRRLGDVRRAGVRRRGDQRRKGRGAPGAQSVLDILLAGLEPTVEVTEREVDRVEALSDELRRFTEEVEAGRA